MNIIISVVRYPELFKLWLENIRWALQHYSYKINVFALEKYKPFLVFDKDINYTFIPTEDKTCYDDNFLTEEEYFTFFHDIHNLYKSKFLDLNDDFIVLMEQDVFFREVLDKDYSFPDESQIHYLISPNWNYLYLKGRDRSYPRIWDEGVILNKKLVLRAIKENVEFGSNLNFIKSNFDNLSELHREVFTNRIFFIPTMPVNFFDYKKFILSDNYKFQDSMLDFQFYCFHNKINIKYNPICDHLDGAERMHLILPASYVKNEFNPFFWNKWADTNSEYKTYLLNSLLCDFLCDRNKHALKIINHYKDYLPLLRNMQKWTNRADSLFELVVKP